MKTSNAIRTAILTISLLGLSTTVSAGLLDGILTGTENVVGGVVDGTAHVVRGTAHVVGGAVDDTGRALGANSYRTSNVTHHHHHHHHHHYHHHYY